MFSVEKASAGISDEEIEEEIESANPENDGDSVTFDNDADDLLQDSIDVENVGTGRHKPAIVSRLDQLQPRAEIRSQFADNNTTTTKNSLDVLKSVRFSSNTAAGLDVLPISATSSNLSSLPTSSSGASYVPSVIEPDDGLLTPTNQSSLFRSGSSSVAVAAPFHAEFEPSSRALSEVSMRLMPKTGRRSIPSAEGANSQMQSLTHGSSGSRNTIGQSNINKNDIASNNNLQLHSVIHENRLNNPLDNEFTSQLPSLEMPNTASSSATRPSELSSSNSLGNAYSHSSHRQKNFTNKFPSSGLLNYVSKSQSPLVREGGVNHLRAASSAVSFSIVTTASLANGVAETISTSGTDAREETLNLNAEAPSNSTNRVALTTNTTSCKTNMCSWVPQTVHTTCLDALNIRRVMDPDVAEHFPNGRTDVLSLSSNSREPVLTSTAPPTIDRQPTNNLAFLATSNTTHVSRVHTVSVVNNSPAVDALNVRSSADASCVTSSQSTLNTVNFVANTSSLNVNINEISVSHSVTSTASSMHSSIKIQTLAKGIKNLQATSGLANTATTSSLPTNVSVSHDTATSPKRNNFDDCFKRPCGLSPDKTGIEQYMKKQRLERRRVEKEKAAEDRRKKQLIEKGLRVLEQVTGHKRLNSGAASRIKDALTQTRHEFPVSYREQISIMNSGNGAKEPSPNSNVGDKSDPGVYELSGKTTLSAEEEVSLKNLLDSYCLPRNSEPLTEEEIARLQYLVTCTEDLPKTSMTSSSSVPHQYQQMHPLPSNLMQTNREVDLILSPQNLKQMTQQPSQLTKSIQSVSRQIESRDLGSHNFANNDFNYNQTNLHSHTTNAEPLNNDQPNISNYDSHLKNVSFTNGPLPTSNTLRSTSSLTLDQLEKCSIEELMFRMRATLGDIQPMSNVSDTPITLRKVIRDDNIISRDPSSISNSSVSASMASLPQRYFTEDKSGKSSKKDTVKVSAPKPINHLYIDTYQTMSSNQFLGAYRAAVKIQALYRGYKVRKVTKHLLKKDVFPLRQLGQNLPLSRNTSRTAKQTSNAVDENVSKMRQSSLPRNRNTKDSVGSSRRSRSSGRVMNDYLNEASSKDCRDEKENAYIVEHGRELLENNFEVLKPRTSKVAKRFVELTAIGNTTESPEVGGIDFTKKTPNPSAVKKINIPTLTNFHINDVSDKEVQTSARSHITNVRSRDSSRVSSSSSFVDISNTNFAVNESPPNFKPLVPKVRNSDIRKSRNISGFSKILSQPLKISTGIVAQPNEQLLMPRSQFDKTFLPEHEGNSASKNPVLNNSSTSHTPVSDVDSCIPLTPKSKRPTNSSNRISASQANSETESMETSGSTFRNRHCRSGNLRLNNEIHSITGAGLSPLQLRQRFDAELLHQDVVSEAMHHLEDLQKLRDAEKLKVQNASKLRLDFEQNRKLKIREKVAEERLAQNLKQAELDRSRDRMKRERELRQDIMAEGLRENMKTLGNIQSRPINQLHLNRDSPQVDIREEKLRQHEIQLQINKEQVISRQLEEKELKQKIGKYPGPSIDELKSQVQATIEQVNNEVLEQVDSIFRTRFSHNTNAVSFERNKSSAQAATSQTDIFTRPLPRSDASHGSFYNSRGSGISIKSTPGIEKSVPATVYTKPLHLAGNTTLTSLSPSSVCVTSSLTTSSITVTAPTMSGLVNPSSTALVSRPSISAQISNVTPSVSVVGATSAITEREKRSAVDTAAICLDNDDYESGTISSVSSAIRNRVMVKNDSVSLASHQAILSQPLKISTGIVTQPKEQLLIPRSQFDKTFLPEREGDSASSQSILTNRNGDDEISVPSEYSESFISISTTPSSGIGDIDIARNSSASEILTVESSKSATVISEIESAQSATLESSKASTIVSELSNHSNPDNSMTVSIEEDVSSDIPASGGRQHLASATLRSSGSQNKLTDDTSSGLSKDFEYGRLVGQNLSSQTHSKLCDQNSQIGIGKVSMYNISHNINTPKISKNILSPTSERETALSALLRNVPESSEFTSYFSQVNNGKIAQSAVSPISLDNPASISPAPPIAHAAPPTYSIVPPNTRMTQPNNYIAPPNNYIAPPINYIPPPNNYIPPPNTRIAPPIACTAPSTKSFATTSYTQSSGVYKSKVNSGSSVIMPMANREKTTSTSSISTVPAASGASTLARSANAPIDFNGSQAFSSDLADALQDVSSLTVGTIERRISEVLGVAGDGETTTSAAHNLAVGSAAPGQADGPTTSNQDTNNLHCQSSVADLLQTLHQEEDLKFQHRKSLLKLQERALIDECKLKLQQLESESPSSNRKKKQRALLLNLHEQRLHIKKIVRTLRSTTEQNKLLLDQQQRFLCASKAGTSDAENIDVGSTFKGRLSSASSSLSPLMSRVLDISAMSTDSEDVSTSSLLKQRTSEASQGSSKLEKQRLLLLSPRKSRLITDRKKSRLPEPSKENESSGGHPASTDSSPRGDSKESPEVSHAEEDFVSADKFFDNSKKSDRVKSPSDSLQVEHHVKNAVQSTHSQTDLGSDLQSLPASAANKVTKSSQCEASDNIMLQNDQLSSNDSESDKSFVSLKPNLSKAQFPHLLRVPLSPRTVVPSRASLEQAGPSTSKVTTRYSSESDDSFSMSQNETSETSDGEGMLLSLQKEVAERKNEVEKLRKEKRKVRRERLAFQEQTLKKQIAIYDKYIQNARQDLDKERQELQKAASVKPVIRRPESRKSRTSFELAAILSERSDGSDLSAMSDSARSQASSQPSTHSRSDAAATDSNSALLSLNSERSVASGHQSVDKSLEVTLASQSCLSSASDNSQSSDSHTLENTSSKTVTGAESHSDSHHSAPNFVEQKHDGADIPSNDNLSRKVLEKNSALDGILAGSSGQPQVPSVSLTTSAVSQSNHICKASSDLIPVSVSRSSHTEPGTSINSSFAPITAIASKEPAADISGKKSKREDPAARDEFPLDKPVSEDDTSLSGSFPIYPAPSAGGTLAEAGADVSVLPDSEAHILNETNSVIEVDETPSLSENLELPRVSSIAEISSPGAIALLTENPLLTRKDEVGSSTTDLMFNDELPKSSDLEKISNEDYQSDFESEKTDGTHEAASESTDDFESDAKTQSELQFSTAITGESSVSQSHETSEDYESRQSTYNSQAHSSKESRSSKSNIPKESIGEEMRPLTTLPVSNSVRTKLQKEESSSSSVEESIEESLQVEEDDSSSDALQLSGHLPLNLLTVDTDNPLLRNNGSDSTGEITLSTERDRLKNSGVYQDVIGNTNPNSEDPLGLTAESTAPAKAENDDGAFGTINANSTFILTNDGNLPEEFFKQSSPINDADETNVWNILESGPDPLIDGFARSNDETHMNKCTESSLEQIDKEVEEVVVSSPFKLISAQTKGSDKSQIATKVNKIANELINDLMTDTTKFMESVLGSKTEGNSPLNLSSKSLDSCNFNTSLQSKGESSIDHPTDPLVAQPAKSQQRLEKSESAKCGRTSKMTQKETPEIIGASESKDTIDTSLEGNSSSVSSSESEARSALEKLLCPSPPPPYTRRSGLLRVERTPDDADTARIDALVHTFNKGSRSPTEKDKKSSHEKQASVLDPAVLSSKLLELLENCGPVEQQEDEDYREELQMLSRAFDVDDLNLEFGDDGDTNTPDQHATTKVISSAAAKIDDHNKSTDILAAEAAQSESNNKTRDLLASASDKLKDVNVRPDFGVVSASGSWTDDNFWEQTDAQLQRERELEELEAQYPGLIMREVPDRPPPPYTPPSSRSASSPSQTPPTPSQAPPTCSQAPPTSSQAPLTSSEAPPTSSQACPTSLQAPPISSQAPPTSSEASTSSETPPTASLTPPSTPSSDITAMSTTDTLPIMESYSSFIWPPEDDTVTKPDVGKLRVLARALDAVSPADDTPVVSPRRLSKVDLQRAQEEECIAGVVHCTNKTTVMATLQSATAHYCNAWFSQGRHPASVSRPEFDGITPGKAEYVAVNERALHRLLCDTIRTLVEKEYITCYGASAQYTDPPTLPYSDTATRQASQRQDSTEDSSSAVAGSSSSESKCSVSGSMTQTSGMERVGAESQLVQSLAVNIKPWRIHHRPVTAIRRRASLSCVEESVMKRVEIMMGYRASLERESRSLTWAKQRKDAVDQVLVAEVVSEEPDWTDYHADEECVKRRLATDLLQAMLSETCRLFSIILSSKMAASTN